MISNAINLHSPKASSDKLPENISDANEDLQLAEQLEFSGYANASLLQQELSTSKKLAANYTDGAKGQANGPEQLFSSLASQQERLADKYANLNQLQLSQSKEGNLDKSASTASTKLATVNLDIQSLAGKADKAGTQMTLPSPASFNQAVSTQKPEATFQANLVTTQLLQATNQITDSDTTHLITATANRTQAAVSQWGPLPVSTNAPLMQQAQEMLTPLREQLRFQIDQQIKQAELRLDPPSLGKVELSIRLDGDRLHIQMHAANPSVRDSLQMGLERLREELAMDHGGQIDLDIGQGDKREQHNKEHAANNIESATDFVEPQITQQDQPNNQIDLLA